MHEPTAWRTRVERDIQDYVRRGARLADAVALAVHGSFERAQLRRQPKRAQPELAIEEVS